MRSRPSLRPSVSPALIRRCTHRPPDRERKRGVIAASVPAQRPADAKLLVVDRYRRVSHLPRATFAELLRPKDLVIANDAATLPASLQGMHVRTEIGRASCRERG